MNQSSKTSAITSIFHTWSDSCSTSAPVASSPAATQAGTGNSSGDAFLTGLLCLEPVSEGCLSGLLRLWQDPVPEKHSEPCEKEKCLGILERFFALEAFGERISEQLRESLLHYFPETPPPAAHAPDVQCEVRADAAGEIQVECKTY